MADGDLVFQKCFGHRWNKIGQFQATVNVRLAFARTGRDMRDVVGFSEFQEGFETQSFLKRMDVLSLKILRLSLVLNKHSTTYTTVEFCTMQNLYL